MPKGWKENKKLDRSIGRKVAPRHREVRLKSLKNITNKQYKYGDIDGDGVININDCYPFDPNRHVHGMGRDIVVFRDEKGNLRVGKVKKRVDDYTTVNMTATPNDVPVSRKKHLQVRSSMSDRLETMGFDMAYGSGDWEEAKWYREHFEEQGYQVVLYSPIDWKNTTYHSKYQVWVKRELPQSDKEMYTGDAGLSVRTGGKEPFSAKHHKKLPKGAKSMNEHGYVKDVEGPPGFYDIKTEKDIYLGQSRETFKNWRIARGDNSKIVGIRKYGKNLDKDSPEWNW